MLPALLSPDDTRRAEICHKPLQILARMRAVEVAKHMDEHNISEFFSKHFAYEPRWKCFRVFVIARSCVLFSRLVVALRQVLAKHPTIRVAGAPMCC